MVAVCVVSLLANYTPYKNHGRCLLKSGFQAAIDLRPSSDQSPHPYPTRSCTPLY